MEWSSTERVSVYISVTITLGDQDPLKYHDRFEDMVRWRLWIGFGPAAGQQSQATYYSYAKRVIFPVIRLEIPQSDNSQHLIRDGEWFLTGDYNFKNLPSPLILFPDLVGNVWEKRGYHPGGSEFYQGSLHQQILQFDAMYLPKPINREGDIIPGFFYFGTDDMWGHPKLFAITQVRDQEPQPESFASMIPELAQKISAHARSGEDLLRLVEQRGGFDKLEKDLASAPKRALAAGWYEYTEFAVGHIGISHYDDGEFINIEDRSPFRMDTNDATRDLPSYSVYTGLVITEEESYWYDVAATYRDFVDAVPPIINGLTPSLYSRTIQERLNLSETLPLIATAGTPYLGWATVDNANEGSTPFARYEDDLKAWLHYFDLDASKEKIYSHLQTWNRRDHPGLSELPYTMYTGSYPRTPSPSGAVNNDPAGDGVHQAYPEFSRMLTGEPYPTDPWQGLGVNFAPYFLLDFVVAQQFHNEILNEHPLNIDLYIWKAWSNPGVASRHAPSFQGGPFIPHINDAGIICLGVDPYQGAYQPPLSSLLPTVEYYARDLSGELFGGTNRYEYQCNGFYADTISGAGLRLCLDAGPGPGSPGLGHRHLHTPSICKPGYHAAPGGAYYTMGKREGLNRLRQRTQMNIDTQYFAGRKVRPGDTAFVVSEACEEYLAERIDITGQGYCFVRNSLWWSYSGDPTSRLNSTPPLFSIVYHDRSRLMAIRTRDTLGALMETNPDDQKFIFETQSHVDAWIEFNCLSRAYELAQGALPLFIFRDFSSIGYRPSPPPTYHQWTNYYHHQLFDLDAQNQPIPCDFPLPGLNSDPTQGNDQERNRRANAEVYGKYLPYLRNLRSLMDFSPALVHGRFLRPLERNWVQGVGSQLVAANPFTTVLVRLLFMDDEGNRIPGSFGQYRPAATFHPGGHVKPPKILSGSFALPAPPPDDQSHRHLVFTNWTNAAAPASLYMKPSWYWDNLGGGAVPIHYSWSYWDPNNNLWVNTPSAVVNATSASSQLFITISASGSGGNPEIRLDKGAGFLDLAARETVLLRLWR